MKLLLDTHVWLWFVRGEATLPRAQVLCKSAWPQRHGRRVTGHLGLFRLGTNFRDTLRREDATENRER